MTNSNSFTAWKTRESLISELDDNVRLFEYWIQTGQLFPNQEGVFDYGKFLALRAGLHPDILPNQTRMVRFDNIEPPVAGSVKIGPFAFHIHNGGLLIILTKEDKEVLFKFNPDESKKLLTFLSQNHDAFRATTRSEEPLVGSKEWVNEHLERKFREMPD